VLCAYDGALYGGASYPHTTLLCARTLEGKTPLELAQEAGHTKVVDVLERAIATAPSQALERFCLLPMPLSTGGYPQREQVVRRKEAGNAAFRAGEIADALVRYMEALDLLSGNLHTDVVTLSINCAACALKANEVRKQTGIDTASIASEAKVAVGYCNQALHLNPMNVKALYRRGLAYEQLHDAQQDLGGVEHCSPLAMEMAAFYQPHALSRHAMQDFELAVCLTSAKDSTINDALIRLRQVFASQVAPGPGRVQ